MNRRRMPLLAFGRRKMYGTQYKKSTQRKEIWENISLRLIDEIWPFEIPLPQAPSVV